MGDRYVYSYKVIFLKTFLIIFLGGGIGSSLRFLINKFIKTPTNTFPWGTLTANVIGCLLIGFVMGWAIKNNLLKTQTVLFLTTGIAGGLTTFSSYIFESFALSKQNYISALLYIFISISCGFVFLLVGNWIAKNM